MSLSNIDGLLSTIAASPVDAIPVSVVEPEPVADSVVDTTEPEPVIAEEKTEPASEPESSQDTDEYGSPVEKKERVYTETEVQQMIRDRLSRGKQEVAPPQQQLPQNEPNGDDWEQQLESFVEQTLTKREQKIQEQNWRQQEQNNQAQFEIKFNAGAAKYPDFEQVVMGKPLTPQMVIATRGMNDPAAFIYAAAKTQAVELERISKMTDGYAQAVELGKLEERMKKGRANSSAAPRPIAGVKGDVGEKANKPRNIDDLLREENAKRSRR